MKVHFLPFLFFFDGLSIKQRDIIDMVIDSTYLQEHRAFEYGINDLPVGVLIGQGITVATKYVVREKNFIRVTMDRSKDEDPDV